MSRSAMSPEELAQEAQTLALDRWADGGDLEVDAHKAPVADPTATLTPEQVAALDRWTETGEIR